MSTIISLWWMYRTSNATSKVAIFSSFRIFQPVKWSKFRIWNTSFGRRVDTSLDEFFDLFMVLKTVQLLLEYNWWRCFFSFVFRSQVRFLLLFCLNFDIVTHVLFYCSLSFRLNTKSRAVEFEKVTI